MKPRTNEISRTQKAYHFQGEGGHWILIAGGALISTLSIRLGYKLKQVLDAKQQEPSNGLKGNGKSMDKKKPGGYGVRSYSYTQDNDACFNCNPGIVDVEIKHQPNGQILTESGMALVSAPVYNKENGVIWASSPDRLEQSLKPFHHSNSSESPCVSESGSDIFSKREVIQKLRQQLKKRDDMILEMQDQMVELQNSLNAQISHSTHLQSLLDAANQEIFTSDREIQRLRKAIADHCVGHVNNGSTGEQPSRSSLVDGYANGEHNMKAVERGRGEGERIEMLRTEVGELKEVIEGKEYLLQSYKEQKAELSVKVRELQQRLDSQLPNIL